jgi:hypothetical protein
MRVVHDAEHIPERVDHGWRSVGDPAPSERRHSNTARCRQRASRRSPTDAPASPCGTAIGVVTVRNGRIVEFDFLNDPERLHRLDLTILED